MRTMYSYAIIAEPDASESVKRFVTSNGSSRYADKFTADEFRKYRDGLSAIGILLVEVERWTENPHITVL